MTIQRMCCSSCKIFVGCFLWAEVLGVCATLQGSLLNSTTVLFDNSERKQAAKNGTWLIVFLTKWANLPSIVLSLQAPTDLAGRLFKLRNG